MTYSCAPPFKYLLGSRQPKMVLVGEAFGKDELAMQTPFVGSSGKELFRMLGEALPDLEPELHAEISRRLGDSFDMTWSRYREPWFVAAGIALTNVLALQPPGNSIDALCANKKAVGGDSYVYKAIKTPGKYLLPMYLPELERLQAEIAELRPNLVVALGNTASWALLQGTNIGSIRGAVAWSNWAGPRVKCLPTYHPASVLYQWSQRTIVVADLMKAGREMRFPEIRRPKRRILINPTIAEVEMFTAILLLQADKQLIEVGADCETMKGQIKMISFATAKDHAIVIPFIDEARPNKCYWQSEAEEYGAWHCVRTICQHPNVRLVGQNFIYDMQYLCPMGIRIARCPEDTMMLHHSLYPEMKKSLGFLGSIYTDEASWKLMRTQQPDTEKRDE